MMQKLLYFIKHPTSLDILINTLGNYINIFFSLLFVLILTRIFTPAEYGVFNVLFGIAYVLANILDFGTTATIYSYLPPLMEEKGENLYRFIKSTFYYQSVFSMIVILILFFTFPYLDTVFFKTGAPDWELYLVATSVLFFIWQNFVTNILCAAKKFFKANLYINLANLAKTVIIFAFMVTGKVTVGSVIFVFGIIGPLIFFVILFMQKKDLVFVLMKTEVKREEFRFGYTMTYFVASQFYNLGTRMDLFILSYFGRKDDTGYYGLSQKIILTIIATVNSITQVLSPLFAKAETKEQLKSFFKKGFTYMLLPNALFAVLIFLPPWVYSVFFTDKFVQAAPITSALSIANLLNAIASVPTLFLLYTIKKPKYILITNIFFFVIVTIGCFMYIPTMGVYAAPWSILWAYVVSTIIVGGATLYEYRLFKPTSASTRS